MLQANCRKRLFPVVASGEEDGAGGFLHDKVKEGMVGVEDSSVEGCGGRLSEVRLGNHGRLRSNRAL